MKSEDPHMCEYVVRGKLLSNGLWAARIAAVTYELTAPSYNAKVLGAQWLWFLRVTPSYAQSRGKSSFFTSSAHYINVPAKIPTQSNTIKTY